MIETRVIDVKNRKGIIGGSDVGAILGVSPYRTPYQAYLSFMGLEGRELTPEEIERLEMGSRLEPFIAELAKDKYGTEFKEPGNEAYFRTETPFIVCHPDRIEKEPDENGNIVGVEIKSSSAFDTSWGEPDTDQIPYSYLCQCYMYFYCGVCDTVKLYRFSNNVLTRYIIEKKPDTEKMIAAIVAKLIRFKEDCDNGIAPPAKTEEDIRIKWTAPTEEVTTADTEMADTVAMYKLLASQKKDIERRMDELKVEIEDSFGNKSYMQDENFNLIATFKTSNTARFDSKTFRKDNPELADKYTKSTASRTLRIK